jgi:ParB-like chromosome segregation protein Spo0J
VAADGSAVGFEVYPAAALFPMLSRVELQELADDIRANGLRESIKLDHTGCWLVDGRNRLAACEIAGVEPRFERLDEGADLDAYVVSCNVERRHLAAGQRAMSVAMIYPDPEKGGRGKASRFRDGLDDKALRNSVSKARAILRFSRSLAEAVMAGDLKLGDAYDQATAYERNRKQRDAQMQGLAEVAPDLAERVERRELEMDEAIAIWQHRDADARKARMQLFELLRNLGVALGHFSETPAVSEISELIETNTYRQELNFVCQNPKALAKALRKIDEVAPIALAIADELEKSQ